MRTTRLFGVPLTVAIMAATAAASGEPGRPEADNRLIGTWKLTSAKYGGQQSSLPETATTLKHITPTHYMWLTHDAAGTITRAAGGTYTLKGEEFAQMGQFGIGPDFTIVKGNNTYKCKVEGSRWHHTGTLPNGLTLDEVWERFERK